MEDVKRLLVIDGDPPNFGNSCQEGIPMARVGFAVLQRLGVLVERSKGDWSHWGLHPDLAHMTVEEFLAEVTKRDEAEHLAFATDVWQEMATEEGWGPR